MGMFDVQVIKELKLEKDKNDLYEFFYKQLSKDEKYDYTIKNDELNIKKNPIDTFLKYNLSAKFDSNTLVIDAELDNSYTLFITLLIILSILFTYGLGILPIIGFVYYQKTKATKYLKTLLTNYGYLN
ncbi:hypothetical protein KO488_06630 [Poseidonibacter lekithochrous]|uniref:hypothetical protein n=1 Tax=Poseidonibacter TaxID=2321187 RepID=UPI001C09C71B|nr:MULTISPECIES: hypothetical protein [Poseidonibacter]MBU3014428.1 hypothetical protein [Poseidonibacter lekithochrous]MDO6827726.1 hypothetical protein [Poseidonibacter sp. 1_MG-2023]